MKLPSAFIIVGISLGVTFARPMIAVEVGGIGINPLDRQEYRSEHGNWFEYILTPGAVIDDTVVISNNSTQAITVDLYPADHTTSSSGGFAVEQATEPRDVIGSWIKLSQSQITIPPEGEVEVPFTIQIPDRIDLLSGDYTGAIMMADAHTPASTATGIILSTRVGVRVYVTIPGEELHHVRFTEHHVQRLDHNPSIVDVAVAMENQGTVNETITLVTNVDMITPWPRWLSRGQQLPYTTTHQIEILSNDTYEYHLALEKPWFGQMVIEHTMRSETGIEEVVTERYMVWPSWYSWVVMISGGIILVWLAWLIRRAIVHHS